MIKTCLRLFAVVMLLPLMAACGGLGLPVPTGSTVSYEDSKENGFKFNHPDNWKVTRLEPKKAGDYPKYDLELGARPSFFVARSNESLYDATTCLIVPQKTHEIFKDDVMTLLFDGTLKALLPDEAKEAKVAYSDVPYDAEDHPAVLSRKIAKYKVGGTNTVTTTQYGSVISRNSYDVSFDWQSYGQLIKLDKAYVSLFCRSQTRYNNLVESLADDLTDSMVIPQ